MLCKCYWIALYIVHVTAFCLGGPFFSPTRCTFVHLSIKSFSDLNEIWCVGRGR